MTDVWVKARSGLLRADSIVKIDTTSDAVLAWQAGTPATEPEILLHRHERHPAISHTMAEALAETIALSRRDGQNSLTIIFTMLYQDTREWRWATR